jgi:Bacteriophage Lambda NinG protein
MFTRRAFMIRTPFVERSHLPGSRKWLIAELDKLTSIIVRKRDRQCVTYGSRQGLQCSHFYSRRYLAIKFDLRNCHAMCGACNKRHNHDSLPYLIYMQSRYGVEVIGELQTLRVSFHKAAEDELRVRLEQYKAMM